MRSTRADAGLSLRALAEAADVAVSTIHRIERGDIHPSVDTLSRIAEAAGVRLRLAAEPDGAASVVGLALCIRRDVERGDDVAPVRRAAELAARFDAGGPAVRRRMIAAVPPHTGDRRWDAFVAGLAQWLAVRGGITTPEGSGTRTARCIAAGG